MFVHLLLLSAIIGVLASIALMVIRLKRSEAVLATEATRFERTAWVFLVCALIGTAASASVLYVGPMILTDSNGSTQITVGSGSSSAASGANSMLTFASGGLVFTDTTTKTYFSIALPIANTKSTSVTFGTAQPDTNYDVYLTTTGVTNGAGNVSPLLVGDKYTTSFEVLNLGGNGRPIGAKGFVVRTTTP